MLKFFSTLHGDRVPFRPLEDGKVKMYVCGITPYDSPHIGHARSYVFFDVVRRYFKIRGFEVLYVQNFTDIDDKIISRAQELKIDYKEVAEMYTKEYFECAKKLNILPADYYPKVTEHIEDIIKMIELILKNGYGYVSGDVYLSVDKLDGYGMLSKKNMDELIAGARVEVSKNKKNPADFVLWKIDEVGFSSPFGFGRPGWHIECSTMSRKYLGDEFDIHGGGMDLIFPHHENEIAQNIAATGRIGARFWLHNGFVTVNREKMSKSLKNFFVLKDVLENFSGAVIRLYLLSKYYRAPLEFSIEALKSTHNAYWMEIYDAYEILNFISYNKNLELKKDFTDLDLLDNDFDTHMLITKLYECCKNVKNNFLEGNFLDALNYGYRILGICDALGIEVVESVYRDPWILERIAERDSLRKAGRFAEADKLREKITESGFILEDTRFGTKVKKKYNIYE